MKELFLNESASLLMNRVSKCYAADQSVTPQQEKCIKHLWNL